MFTKFSPNKVYPRRLEWIIICLFSIIVLLLSVSLAAHTALAASDKPASREGEAIAKPVLQVTATPTPTVQIGSTATFSFSLASLGGGERTLSSPYETTEYFFRLPDDWVIQADNVLNLDLSYNYNQVGNEEIPTQFGDLTVLLDDQTLEIFSIAETELNHYQLHIPLPQSILDDPEQARHSLKLTLDAAVICQISHKAKILIHPDSSIISLTYEQGPLTFDLADYPRPFYQQTFDPDRVRFVLPAQPTANDLANNLAVAAKLGDLTGNRLVISATTDVDLGDPNFDTSPALDEHLIIVAQPQDNQLISLLNDVTDLPVSLHQQQLNLTAVGPLAIAPGDTFTYVFTITNTLERPVELALVNSLSLPLEMLDCTPECEYGNDNTVTWSDNLLDPAEIATLSLTLQADETITDTIIENTITLIETDLGPVNADTITSSLDSNLSARELQVSDVKEGDYFFVYNGRAVAREDGIIQEILSPWNQKRAILMVTGLTDKAVQKASQAMSSEARLPGMRGAVALVKDILPLAEIDQTRSPAEEFTFAELGYYDQVIQGITLKQIDYYFNVPYGWQLTDDAVLDLYFNHSQLINYNDSGLSILINREPVATVRLNDETAANGNIRIELSNANIREAENRLTIEADMAIAGDICVEQNTEQAWLLIQDHSKIFLAHQENNLATEFDFSYFPAPFHLNATLADLLFVLPQTPSIGEWEAALHLASALGDSAGGNTIMPAATLDDNFEAEELSSHHIIAVGRPSRNALIQQVNTQLPQPFLPDSDQIEQYLDDVIFRLPADLALGYLQLIPSPWNEDQALLVVTGTTDESVGQAMDVLSYQTRTLRNGNLVLVRNEAVDTIDTRNLTSGGVAMTVATAIPEMTPVATSTMTTAMVSQVPVASPTPETPSASQIPQQVERPVWLIPLVGITGLIVLGIFAFVFWQARLKKA